jgi:hypothetical protein
MIEPGQVAFSSAPRPGKHRNEDLIATIDGVVMLLDGASVPAGMPACCGRDAAWYVQALATALTGQLAADSGVALTQALAEAIDVVSDQHQSDCSGDRDAMGPTATVLLARLEGEGLDWLALGDSTLLLQTDREVTEHTDRRLKAIAPELRQRILKQLSDGGGYDNPAHLKALTELVSIEREARNRPGGYWIAGADPSAAERSLTGIVPIGESPGAVRRVALLSDGAERAVTMFSLYPSWEALLEALITGGPEACIEVVRMVEAADPDGRHYPRTKASDDASALIWGLAGSPPVAR